jgi:predicted glycoside hydrolase/deacetylase ChbG (UPF0249 family)
MKQLIVNADDCNLTPGVTEAILKCHDRGIVTSTSFLVNLPCHNATVRKIKSRRELGVGLHLNVTLGRPVSEVFEVRSLLDDQGSFRRPQDYAAQKPKADELETEYRGQVELFRRVFGLLPTHLDTHHQMHDERLFFQVIEKLARDYRLPVRRARLMGHQCRLKTTDFLFGNVDPSHHWDAMVLTEILRNLPEGTSEIMCHPGKNDAALRKVSSLTTARAEEYEIFSSPVFRRMVRNLGISLTHYGVCYNKTTKHR